MVSNVPSVFFPVGGIVVPVIIPVDIPADLEAVPVFEESTSEFFNKRSVGVLSAENSGCKGISRHHGAHWGAGIQYIREIMDTEDAVALIFDLYDVIEIWRYPLAGELGSRIFFCRWFDYLLLTTEKGKAG